ncbi:MAG: B12-binding domain-containing radical SAM protein [Deltaproteobacteria bacterium]|nr:B12-binding domain-containing radical SAM protein [Deltaproteobacteria bacterium]
MRVLVVQTNTYPLLGPTPLGAALVAMRLEQAGHDVRFVDLMYEERPTETALRAASEHAPELCCFSIRNRDNMSPSRYFDPIPSIGELVREVKAATGAPALIGGAAFTTFPAQILEAVAADYGLAGDDLEPIAHLVESLAAGEADLETPGLVWRDDAGAIHQNPYRLVGYAGVRFDCHRFLDFDRYRKGYWQAAVVTRTGCPEQCLYCDTHVTFGDRFRLRDPALVAEELLALKRTGKVRSVFLVDDGFNRPLDHAKEVLREILRQGAQLTLQSIFDPGEADREFFELFRRAGGLMVTVFAESLSDPVLAALKKPFGYAEIERDCAELRRAGIAAMIMPTFGSPGETRETVDETLARLPRLKASYVDFSIGWRLQPKTGLFARAVEEGLVEADDDLFAPHFYVSPRVEASWIEERIRRYRRRHPLRHLRMAPMIWRTVTERPWRRGPELPA